MRRTLQLVQIGMKPLKPATSQQLRHRPKSSTYSTTPTDVATMRTLHCQRIVSDVRCASHYDNSAARSPECACAQFLESLLVGLQSAQFIVKKQQMKRTLGSRACLPDAIAPFPDIRLFATNTH